MTDVSIYNIVLPVAAVTAIVLFLLRELFEYLKRRASDSRATKAFLMLIAHECELNNWSIKTTKNILASIQENIAANPETKFTLQILRNGEMRFGFSRGDTGGGQGLFPPHTDMHKRVLVDAAKLDRKLYKLVRENLDEITELEHIQRSLVHYLTTDSEFDLAHFDSFVEWALENIPPIEANLAETYRECTGKKLEVAKLR